MPTERKVTMTVDLAQELLANRKNRHLRTDRVETFKNIFLNGDYLYDASAWKVDIDGKLRAGQHRAQGFVEATREAEAQGRTLDPVTVLLVEGLDPRAALVDDTNLKKSFGHQLEAEGVPSAMHIAAICTLLWKYENGWLESRSKFHNISRNGPSHPALMALFEERRDLLIEAQQRGRRLATMSGIGPTVMSVAWMIFNGYAIAYDPGAPVQRVLSDGIPEDASEFFSQLILDSEVKPRTGPVLLRNIFASKVRKVRTQQDVLALVIKAWNLYRRGEEAENLYWRPGGTSREHFPVPE